MVIEIAEYKFPNSVDREFTEHFGKHVVAPACEKAGFKMIRFGWLRNGEGMNVGIFIGEMDSLDELEKYWESKEHQQLEKEIARLFPEIEAKVRIVEVI